MALAPKESWPSQGSALTGRAAWPSSAESVASSLLPRVNHAPAFAQDLSTGPYEFILAKLAVGEGHFDEAITRIDKVIQANSANPVLRYERAMILLEAGKPEQAERDLRQVTAGNPDFYDAQRVLGRL